MRKACLHIANEEQGTNNYPFVAGPEGVGFKNMLYSFPHLKKVLASHNIDLATRDINKPESSEFLFCWDNPHTVAAEKKEGQVWSLLINDPPMYCPESWDPHCHDRFDYVFTFDETRVDNKKYFYYPFAQDTEFFSIPDIVSEEEFRRRTLATFASHAIQKYPDPEHPGSTLHLRYETIEWYGKNHPDDFGFYGGTFEERDYYFGFRGVRFVKPLLPGGLFHSLAGYLQRDLRKVYKGRLSPLEKFEVIRGYNFYYCYENTIGINGYVCEKIFDCFYHGIVPVYWGAPNIKELIPYECFIDGREFTNQKDLYDFIKGMNYQKYRGYLEEAQVFLRSPEVERFTVRSSIEHVLKPLQQHISDRQHAMGK